MGRSSKRCPCSQVPCHAHGTRGEDAVGTRAVPPARTHTHARTRTRVRARRRLPPRCSGPRCSRRRRAATGRWAQDPASASPGTPVRRADSLARDGELDARLGHHVDHRCAPAPPPASGSSPSLTKPSLESDQTCLAGAPDFFFASIFGNPRTVRGTDFRGGRAAWIPKARSP